MTVIGSLVRWALIWVYFALISPLVIVLSIACGPWRIDGFIRWMCRTLVRLSGARLQTRIDPGFDATQPCFLVCNHVNVFDPFVLYAAIPMQFRGMELESHFRVPLYGWMMRRFGSIPVPNARTPKALKQTYRSVRELLERGISLAVLPEGTRTRTGMVGPFEDGAFRMARQLGFPIVPVTLEGSFHVKRPQRWLLRPGPVTVHVHPRVETAGLERNEIAALRDRVRAIVAAPLRQPVRG